MVTVSRALDENSNWYGNKQIYDDEYPNQYWKKKSLIPRIYVQNCKSDPRGISKSAIDNMNKTKAIRCLEP